VQAVNGYSGQCDQLQLALDFFRALEPEAWPPAIVFLTSSSISSTTSRYYYLVSNLLTTMTPIISHMSGELYMGVTMVLI
jgi:hypothetical protein